MPAGTGLAAAVPLLGLLIGMAGLPAPAAADDELAKLPANHPPTGSFAWAPAAPHTGDIVTFTATSSDVDGDAVTAAWDVDGDKRFESTGPSAIGRWTQAGPRAVTLRLTDARGKSTVVRRVVDIQNSPPVAAFSVAPVAPLAGEDVVLTSQATDPDGGTLDLQQTWDLDGDGAFDDATGAIAHASFPAGDHVVRLRVVDAKGAATVAEQHVTVTVPVPISALSSASGRPLSPFPIVRMTGRLTRRGVHVTLLSVFAPRGSRVAVLCHGGGCPRGVIRRAIPSKGPRFVRVRSLRRTLRPGTRIEIRVTKAGLVGKYTSFRVRRHGAPRRSDRCLPPGSATPRPCR